MKPDLKSLRERKGLTAEEFAQALNKRWNERFPNEPGNFTADKVIRMEKDPRKMDAYTIDLVCDIYGITYEQLFRPTHPHLKPPTIDENNWQRISSLRRELEKGIEDLPETAKEKYAPALKEYRKEIAFWARKPKLAFIGQPDSGKSTQVNALIGRNIFPTNWTPTTSAPAVIKHLDDRPDWLKPDTVAVFRDGVDLDRVCNAEDEEIEAYRSRYLLEKGDYSLIAEYGAHGGTHEDENSGGILVYVDSPMLRNCDFMDLPGITPGSDPEQAPTAETPLSRDKRLTVQASQSADAFVLLCQASGLSSTNDDVMLKTVLLEARPFECSGRNHIKPFGNIFILGTHADAVAHGDAEHLDRLFDTAAERIWKLVEGNAKMDARRRASGYECGFEDLRRRFFTSEIESQVMTDAFYQDLAGFLNELPFVWETRMRDNIRMFRKAQAAAFADEVMRDKAIRDDHDQARARLDEMDAGENERAETFRSKDREATDIILAMKEDTRDKCRAVYNKVINSGNVVSVIEANGLKKNKRDLQELVNLLNAEMENKISAELARKALALKEKIDILLAETQQSFDRTVDADFDMGDSLFGFNVSRAFAGGLSGLAAFGALSAWAATCGNLGGYILIAKAVGALASVGIHIGGAAAATAGVAAIGGPVTLAIAIAVMASLTVLLTLGGTWKKVIGNKIVQIYAEKNVLTSLLAACDGYWAETLKAFRAGMDQVEREWQALRKEYRDKVENYDDEALEQDIQAAEQIRDFFTDTEE